MSDFFGRVMENPSLSDNILWLTIVSAIAVTISFIYFTGGLMSRIRASNCLVSVEWNEEVPNRVGGLAKMKIKLFKTPGVLQLTEFPDVDSTREQLDKLKVTVLLEKQEIPLDKEITAENHEMHVVFPIRKAGTYTVFISYAGFEVAGSPFAATIDPDKLDPYSTTVDVKEAVIIVQGQQFLVYITPRDSFGNICDTCNEDVRLMSFNVEKYCCTSCQGKSVCDTENKDFQHALFGIRGGNGTNKSKTSLRRSSSVDSMPIVYTLYGKCRGVGRYRAMVTYDGIPLHCSDRKSKEFEIISMSVAEETKLLEKQFQGIYKFEALRILTNMKLSENKNKNVSDENEGKKESPEDSEEDIEADNPVSENNDLILTSSEDLKEKEELENKNIRSQEIGPHLITEDIDAEVYRRVNVELTSRFVYFTEEMYGGPLNKRLSTLRLSNRTELEILRIQDFPEMDTYSFELFDYVQNMSEQFLMAGSEARVFLALFYDSMSKIDLSPTESLNKEHSTLKDNRKLEEKYKSMYKAIRSIYGRYVKPTSMPHTILRVRRAALVESSLERLQRLGRYAWGKSFVIIFQGEPVKSAQAAWDDWSNGILESLLENNAHGMFQNLSSGLIHPNPNRNPRWTNDHYELAGKLIGKYIVENALHVQKQKHLKSPYYRNIHVHARFSRSFLGMLLSMPPTYKHVQTDDPEEFESTYRPLLSRMDVEQMGLTFTGQYYDSFGNILMRDLIPGGSLMPVTNENKIFYLNALTNFKYAVNVQGEVDAFRRGITFLVPEDLFMHFDENELELLLCGSSKLSPRDLQLNHYSSVPDFKPETYRLKDWLLKSLEQMDTIDFGRFLQFTTGSSRLPNESFGNLHPKLKITFSSLFGQLPTANRRLHQICLTDHTSPYDFHNSLLQAIRGLNFED